MTEAVQPNSDAARTETGELKPSLSSPPTTTATTPPTPPTPPATESKEDQTKSTTESKPDDKPKTLLNQEEKKEDDAAKGAPETYAAFKVPEGFEIDEATNKEIGGLFKKMNLSQENAQELVDLYSKRMIDAQRAPYDHWKKTNDDWVAEIKADPELGSKIPEVKATIAKALDGLGSPQLTQAFKDAMELTGAGNNPAFVRAFYKLSKLVTEGTHVSGNGPSRFGQSANGVVERPTPAKAIYPNLG